MLTWIVIYLGGAAFVGGVIAATQPPAGWKPRAVAMILWPIALIAMAIALFNDARRALR